MLGASEVSPKMFDNPVLDFFSRTPWWTVPLVFLPLVALQLWWGFSAGVHPLWMIVQFVLGGVIWSLTEYWLHRTAFHWEPDTWWGPKFHFFVHGVHHQWHKDPYRLVMPPAVSLSLYAAFYGIFSLVALALSPLVGTSWFWAFYGGFVFGYVVYDVTHYVIHHMKLRGKSWLMTLRKHHMAHHHNPKDAERKFGVSNTVWDHVFGTA